MTMTNGVSGFLALGPVQKLLNRLEQQGYDPRPCGTDKWRSLCPGHRGDSPSLSIAVGTDGVVLLNCNRGDQSGKCTAKAIVSELGLEVSDLFPPAVGLKPSTNKTRKTGWDKPQDAGRWQGEKLGAEYGGNWPYRDRDGKVYSIIYRYNLPSGKKEFRPVSLDPGTGRWLLKDPSQWLPYRINEIGTAPRVFFHEGEKCTDVGWEICLPSTTTAHGAKSPQKTDLGDMAGREVVILPDVGEAGEAYAAKLVKLLGKLKPPAQVKILRLPGLVDDGDDIEQFVEARPGATAEELRSEIEALVDSLTVASFPGDAAEIGPKPSANGTRRGHNPYVHGFNGDGVTFDQEIDKLLSGRPHSDLGNAERMVVRYGNDLHFCHPWKKYIVWDGRRWKTDDTARARRYARVTVRSMLLEAGTIASDARRKAHTQWALASEKRDRIAAMLSLAEAEPGVPILPEDMDSDPWSFNCRNGTIDLRTGELRPHRRSDLITKLCDLDYDPTAECPLWLGTLAKFLAREDPEKQAELIDYWQKLCGYAMAGVVEDHILPVAYGTGENGKSTILGTFMDVLGPDYAMKAPPDLLMAKRGESHPTERADLFGKRLVVAIETEEGRRLNETMVKELTGGDKIRARRMREDHWEFKPTHTAIMAVNHKPIIRGTDKGIWRRVKIVPFTVSIDSAEAIKDMPARLRAEWPGILAWCVRGCLAWKKKGLEPPKEVVDATAKYRKDQDVLGSFLDEHAVIAAPAKVKAGALYARYKAWAESGNEFVMSQKAFSEALVERGFEKTRSDGAWYRGIGLADASHGSEDTPPNREKGEV